MLPLDPREQGVENPASVLLVDMAPMRDEHQLHAAVVDALYAARYGARQAPPETLRRLQQDVREFALAVG